MWSQLQVSSIYTNINPSTYLTYQQNSFKKALHMGVSMYMRSTIQSGKARRGRRAKFQE
jgi:hypothetical protein